MNPRFIAIAYAAVFLLGAGMSGTFLSYVSRVPDVVSRSDHGTILVVGDLFFDRYIRQVGEQNGEDYLFSCINPLLRSADFVVGNLEGPITEKALVSAGSIVGGPENYQFTFPPTTAELLARHNIRAVNIGNNHITNFGIDGMRTTQGRLRTAGVGFFGGIADDEPVFRTELRGTLLSFVSYNEFGGQPPERVAEVIAEERAADRLVIVYAHWSDEYVPPTEHVRAAARLFAQSGAAIIIGSHPHVVLKSERIGTVPVFYSLGNFLFDQYWSEEVSTGLTLLITFRKEGMHIEEIQVALHRDGRVCVKEV